MNFITSFTLFILGIFVLIFPEFINEDGFWLKLSDFLLEYPLARYPLGIALSLIGLVGIVFFFCDIFRIRTAYVIQRARRYEFGDSDLQFPKWAIGSKNPLIYTNLTTVSTNDEVAFALEKDNIKAFYSEIKPKKRIAFLSVAIFPFIVYAGYIVGDSGRKIKFFHYDRKKRRARILWAGIRSRLWLKEEDVGKNNSSEVTTICISTSYLIEKDTVTEEFGGTNIRYFCVENPSTEAIKTKKDLETIAEQVRAIVIESGNNVNLLLSCSAELCFAIGQKLAGPYGPNINVYNYYGCSNSKKWNWCISLGS